MRKRILLLAGALVAAAPRVQAQVRGTVVDEQHHPLGDAVVDLWSPTARLGRAVTGSTGTFQFPSDPSATRLVARRIGSAPVDRALASAGTPLEIVLVGRPVTLPAVEVTGACGKREDPEARRAWERAAAWYRELPDSLIIETSSKFTRERVPMLEVGRPLTDSMGYTLVGYAPLARAPGEARVLLFGYPAPDPERDEVLSGNLLPAEMQHLASSGFGNRIRFTTIDDTRIRFCPKDRELPWIEGEFTLAEDGSLLWGRWMYRARSEGWATGAVATFASPSLDRGSPLVPTSFVLWQERGSGMAAEWSEEFRSWEMKRPYGIWLPAGAPPGRDTSMGRRP